MKILFHLGHPAHFHLFKNTILNLKANGHTVAILIKKKDILEDLLKSCKFEYYNILPNGRKGTKLGMVWGIVKSDFKLLKFSISFKPDLMVGTSFAISHVGKLLNIPSINFNEDDSAVVPLYSHLSYPWATRILSPKVCHNGKWENKSIKYEGYHELAYLHPNNFRPSIEVVKRYIPENTPYFLIRFAQLTAHHDKGIKGINDVLALKLIEILKHFGSVYITSEREMVRSFEQYRLPVNPLDMHHILAFAQIFIGDSQTMAAEAGVLGTPFIRFNDFVGRIGYLNELEDKYQLGFGIKPNNPDKLFEVMNKLLSMPNREEIFEQRRQRMLSEKIDSSNFITWLLENYPESVKLLDQNLNYHLRFKEANLYVE